MGTYGDLWWLRGDCGGLWGPMETRGDLSGPWDPIGTYEDLVGPMKTYSFVYGDIICDERHMKCSRRSGRI